MLQYPEETADNLMPSLRLHIRGRLQNPVVHADARWMLLHTQTHTPARTPTADGVLSDTSWHRKVTSCK